MEFIRHRKSHTVTGPVHYVCHAGLSHLSSYAGHKIQLFSEDLADWKALRSFFFVSSSCSFPWDLPAWQAGLFPLGQVSGMQE